MTGAGQTSPARQRRLHWLLVVLLLAASAGLALTSLVGDSITFDETSHLAAGMSYLLNHDYRLAPDHPPLAKFWAAWPLVAGVAIVIVTYAGAALAGHIDVGHRHLCPPRSLLFVLAGASVARGRNGAGPALAAAGPAAAPHAGRTDRVFVCVLPARRGDDRRTYARGVTAEYYREEKCCAARSARRRGGARANDTAKGAKGAKGAKEVALRAANHARGTVRAAGRGAENAE